MWFRNYLQLSCKSEQEINEAIAYVEGNDKIRDFINLINKKIELLENDTLAISQLSKDTAIKYTQKHAADLIKRYLEDKNGHEINAEIYQQSELLKQQIRNLPTEEVFELRKAILKILENKPLSKEILARLMQIETMRAQELKDLLVEIS